MPGPALALGTYGEEQHRAAALKELLIWDITEQRSLFADSLLGGAGDANNPSVFQQPLR